MNSVSNIKNNDLLEMFSLAVLNERQAIGEVISYLSHIWERKLFAEEGYPSLFNFLIEKYQYSKAAAYRRIQAAKLVQREPRVLEHLKDAKLNLTTIGLIEPFAKGDKCQILIESSLGKTKEQVEELLSEFSYKVEIKRDRIRRLPKVYSGSAAEPNVSQKKTDGFLPTPLSFSDTRSGTEQGGVIKSETRNINQTKMLEIGSDKDSEAYIKMPVNLYRATEEEKEIRRVKIEFVADESVAKKIERAQEILRHKYPRGLLADIINEALELLLNKKDPWRKIARLEKRKFVDLKSYGETTKHQSQEFHALTLF